MDEGPPYLLVGDNLVMLISLVPLFFFNTSAHRFESEFFLLDGFGGAATTVFILFRFLIIFLLSIYFFSSFLETLLILILKLILKIP